MTSHASIKISLAVCLGLFVTITAVQAGTAGYDNPSIPDKGSAAYWLDQGGLLTTYGNFKAAVDAYAKALTIAPNNSEILFDMAIAYAEMGDYQKALANIDRAISLSPENGRFHYGRGWVFMRSGQSDKAYPEFRKAAELGNFDAKLYLQGEMQ